MVITWISDAATFDGRGKSTAKRSLRSNRWMVQRCSMNCFPVITCVVASQFLHFCHVSAFSGMIGFSYGCLFVVAFDAIDALFSFLVS
jgi:hypothetical protein